MIFDDDTIGLIEEEIKGCFDFFWNESNAVEGEIGYGMTADVAGRPICSLAAVGFAFPAYVIGVERGYITFEEGYNRVLKTLETLKKVVHNAIVNGEVERFVMVGGDPCEQRRYAE